MTKKTWQILIDDGMEDYDESMESITTQMGLIFPVPLEDFNHWWLRIRQN